MGFISGVRSRFSGALAGAAHLSGGAAAAQVITLVASLVIARLYTPAELGVLSAVLSLAMLISPLVTFGLQIAIVPARTDADALRLARIALGSVVVSAVITAIVLAIVPLPEPHVSERRGFVVFYVPLMLLVLGAFAVLSQVTLRQRQYRAMAVRGVAQSSLIAGIQIGGSVIRHSDIWLFTGELVGRAVGTASLVPHTVRFARSVPRPLPPAREVIKRYADAIRYYLPATAMEMAAGQVIVLAIAAWFGPTQTGYLSQANRAMAVPIVLIGAAVGQVLGSELARRRRMGDTQRSQERLRQLILGLTAVGIAFSLVMILFGPWLFTFAFGDQWREAGELARYISIPTAVGLVWNPVSMVYPSYERLRLFLVICALRLSGALGAGIVLHAMGYGWMTVAVGMSAGVAAAQIVGIWLAWRIVANDSAGHSGPEASEAVMRAEGDPEML